MEECRAQTKNSKYIKLQPSEKTVLQFNPEKIEQTDVEFNGTKTQRYQYIVTERNSGSNLDELGQNKRIEFDKTEHTLAFTISF